MRVTYITHKTDPDNDKNIVGSNKMSIGISRLDSIQIGIIALNTQTTERIIRIVEVIVDAWIGQDNHHISDVGLQALQDGIELSTVVRCGDWCSSEIGTK